MSTFSVSIDKTTIKDNTLNYNGLIKTYVTDLRKDAFLTMKIYEKGVRVITLPDIRWLRRDIKSTSLLFECNKYSYK